MLQKFSVKNQEICPVKDFTNSEVEAIASQAKCEYRPQSESELEKLLKELHASGSKYDVVSGSCNWGLGQKFTTESMLINLENLKKIDLDEQTGVIYVEAGVTQEEVNRYLKEANSEYYLDVTGSAKESSLVGNCLERGISYSSQRLKNLINMELYLRCGTKVSTGLLGSSELRKLYPHTSGPDLKGLFLQSRFGVVVGIYYLLKKKESYSTNLQLKVKNREQLLAIQADLSSLMRDGIINGIPHIANAQRSKQSFLAGLRMMLGDEEIEKSTKFLLDKLLGDENAWTGLICLKGERADVAWRRRKIKSILSKNAELRELGPIKLKILETFSQCFSQKQWAKLLKVLLGFAGLSQGRSTNLALLSMNDSLEGEYSKVSLDRALKASDTGFLYCLPIMKFQKELVDKALEIVEKYWGSFGEAPAITLNPLDANVVELVVSLRFPRKKSGEVHLALSEMLKEMEKSDIHLYRHPLFSDRRAKDESECLSILEKIVHKGK